MRFRQNSNLQTNQEQLLEHQVKLWQKLNQGFERINEVFQNTAEDNYDVLVPELTNLIINENYDSYVSNKQLEFFKQGLKHSINYHLGKYRDDGSPYVTHPVSVSLILATWDRPINTLIAGKLHDVLEEKGKHLEGEINTKFGYEVFKIVDGVSIFEENRTLRDYAQKRKILKTTQEMGTYEILFLKQADVLHNLKTVDSMKSKNGLTATKRKETFIENVIDNHLQFSKFLDKKNIIEFKLEWYALHLISNYTQKP